MAKKPARQARSQGPLSSNPRQVTASNPFPHWDALVNWLDLKKDKGGFRLNSADLDKFNEFLNSKDKDILTVSLKVSLAEALFDQIHDNEQWNSFDKDGFVMITRLFLRADYCLSQERALYQLRISFIERKKRDTSGSLYAIAEKLIPEFHNIIVHGNHSVRIKRLVAHFLASLTVGDEQCKKALAQTISKDESVYGNAIINHPDYIIRVTYCMVVSQVVGISKRKSALDRFFKNADKGLLDNFPQTSWEAELNQWLKEFIAFFSGLQQQEVELDQWLPPSFFALHIVINEFRQTKNGPTGLASFSKEGYLSLFFSNDSNDLSCVDIKLCNVDEIRQADTMVSRHGRKAELRCLNIGLKDFENFNSFFLFDLEDVQRADVSISITCHLDDSPDIEKDILRLRDKHQALLKKKMSASTHLNEDKEDSPFEDIQLSQQITKLPSRKIKFLNQVSAKPDEFFDSQMGASTDTEVTLPPGILNDSDKPVPLKYANFKTQLTAEQRNYRSTASVSPSKQQKSKALSVPKAVESNAIVARFRKDLTVPHKPVKAKDRMQDKSGNLSSPISARTPGGKQSGKAVAKTAPKPTMKNNGGGLSAPAYSPIDNLDNYAFPSGEDGNTNLRVSSTKKSSKPTVNKGKSQGLASKSTSSTVKTVTKNGIQPKAQSSKAQAQAPKSQSKSRKSTKRAQSLLAKQGKDGFEDENDDDYDPGELSPPKRRRIDASPKPSDEVKLNPRKSAIKAEQISKDIIAKDSRDETSDDIQEFSSSLRESSQFPGITVQKTNNIRQSLGGSSSQMPSNKRPDTGIKFQHCSSSTTVNSRFKEVVRSENTKKGSEERPSTPSSVELDDIDGLMEAEEEKTKKKDSMAIKAKKTYEQSPVREKFIRDAPLTNEALSKKPQIIAFDEKKGALNQGHVTFSDDNLRPSSPDMDHPANSPYVVVEDEGSPSPPDPSGRTAEVGIDSDIDMPNVIDSDHELDDSHTAAGNISMSVHTNDMAPESTTIPGASKILGISKPTQDNSMHTGSRTGTKLQLDEDGVKIKAQAKMTKTLNEKQSKQTMKLAKKEASAHHKVSELGHSDSTNDISELKAAQKKLSQKRSRATDIASAKQEQAKLSDETTKPQTKELTQKPSIETAKEQVMDSLNMKADASIDTERAQRLADQAFEMLQKRLALEMPGGLGPDVILQSLAMATAQSESKRHLQSEKPVIEEEDGVIPQTKAPHYAGQPLQSGNIAEPSKSRPISISARPEGKSFGVPIFNKNLPTPGSIGDNLAPANIPKPQQMFTKQFETPMSVLTTSTPTTTFQDDKHRKFLRFPSKLSESVSVEHSVPGAEYGIGSPLARKASNDTNKAVHEPMPVKSNDIFIQRLKQISEDRKNAYQTPKHIGGQSHEPTSEHIEDPDRTLVNELSDDNTEQTVYYGKGHKGAAKDVIPGYHRETSKALRQISEYLMQYLMTSEESVNVVLGGYHDEINRFQAELNIQLEDGMKNTRDKLSELKKLGFEAHNVTKLELEGLAEIPSSDAVMGKLKGAQHHALASVKKEIEMLKV